MSQHDVAFFADDALVRGSVIVDEAALFDEVLDALLLPIFVLLKEVAVLAFDADVLIFLVESTKGLGSFYAPIFKRGPVIEILAGKAGELLGVLGGGFVRAALKNFFEALQSIR